MDSSLALMFAFTALYAGSVAFLVTRRQSGTRRSALAGLLTALAVGASLPLMVGMAHLSYWAMLVAIALFAGAVTYLAFVRDLSRNWTVGLTIGAALVITACAVVVSYLAVMAYVGAIGIYLVLRMWVRVKPALILMGTALSGFLALSVAAFFVAVMSM